MHRDARALAGGVETRNDGLVVGEDLGLDVGRNPTHRVVGGRHDRHRLDDRVDTQVGARELGDVGEFGLENLSAQVRAVQEDVVTVGSRAAAFGDFLLHAAADDVAGGEVLDGGCVAFHEALTARVAQDRAFAAGALGQQDAETGKPGRVELEELHVLQRQALAPHDSDTITGEGVRVGGRLVDLAEPARGEDHGLGLEDVQLSGCQFVGHDARDLGVAVGIVHRDEVEDVELVEEVDAELDAVLEQRLQDHVAGAVSGVAGATHGALAVVGGVAAEASLVDLSLGRPVEGQTHVLEVDDRVDRLFRQDLSGILVDEVVATLDGVEGVPLPGVFLDVRQGSCHAALGRARVRPGGVELGDHRGLRAGACLDGRAHPGAAGADDHDVELVVVDAVLDDAFGALSSHGCCAFDVR